MTIGFRRSIPRLLAAIMLTGLGSPSAAQESKHLVDSTKSSHEVTRTLDSGWGTMRQAILDVNAEPGPASITFNIPLTDTNFVGYQDDGIPGTYNPEAPIVRASVNPDPDGPLWWRIVALSPLPSITRSRVLVDGSSQRFTHGNTNPYGPEVEIVRDPNAMIDDGLVLACEGCVARELIINAFGLSDLHIVGNDNLVEGSYLGIEPGGTRNTIHTGASSQSLRIEGDRNVIGGLAESSRNLISGGSPEIIFIEGSGNLIVGNYLGVNRQLNAVTTFGPTDIQVWWGVDNRIESNVLGGGAIELWLEGANHNTIRFNYVGTDPTGQLDLAGDTAFGGIYLVGSDNLVGPGNVIKYHRYGISITGQRNTVSRNSISSNDYDGIRLAAGGNGGISRPAISLVTANHATGSASPGSLVEIFSDRANQGAVYEGVTQADYNGNFTWYGRVAGPSVTATATDGSGNSSQFSLPYRVHLVWLPGMFSMTP